MGEWLLYNFAAGSFHTKKVCIRLYSTEVLFFQIKNKKSLLSHPPFGGLAVNIRITSIALWKARDRLAIHRN